MNSAGASTVARTTGRPDACSLCHVDRPLDWTAGHLAAWSGRAAGVTDERGTTGGPPAAVEWALAGDAQQRAVVADAFGRDLVVLEHAARRTPIAAATPELLSALVERRR